MVSFKTFSSTQLMQPIAFYSSHFFFFTNCMLIGNTQMKQALQSSFRLLRQGIKLSLYLNYRTAFLKIFKNILKPLGTFIGTVEFKIDYRQTDRQEDLWSCVFAA